MDSQINLVEYKLINEGITHVDIYLKFNILVYREENNEW